MDYMSPSNFFDLDKDGNIDLDSGKEFIKSIRALAPWKTLYENNSQLDLYSYKFYESENYWWILQIYNDIIDPDDTGIISVTAPVQSDVDQVLSKYAKSSQ